MICFDFVFRFPFAEVGLSESKFLFGLLLFNLELIINGFSVSVQFEEFFFFLF